MRPFPPVIPVTLLEPHFEGKKGPDRQAGIGSAVSVLNLGGDKLRIRVPSRPGEMVEGLASPGSDAAEPFGAGQHPSP